MSRSFDCTNCGLCCGPVPVKENELKKIQKFIKGMPIAEYHRLKSQQREPLDCMFRDVKNDRCSIYKVRPEICRMFGFYEGMICPYNPDHATRSKEMGHKRLNNNKDLVVGVLSINYNWNNIV